MGGPEAATPERLAELNQFVSKTAIKCAKAMPRERLRIHHWFPIFGDATDLEVDGRCFDAARVDRNGRILALLPPIHVSLLTGGDFCS